MKKFTVMVMFFVMFFIAGIANAGTFSWTFPEYSSPSHNPGTYYDQYLVGTFNFAIPLGEAITSATISGQWGNSVSSSTAHNLLFVDTQQVANTHDYTPDPYYNTVAWSYDFFDFSVLNDGIANFYTVQTSEYVVRLGETTLTINTAATGVPEPATLLLLGLGLVGVTGVRRKFNK